VRFPGIVSPDDNVYWLEGIKTSPLILEATVPFEFDRLQFQGSVPPLSCQQFCTANFHILMPLPDMVGILRILFASRVPQLYRNV